MTERRLVMVEVCEHDRIGKHYPNGKPCRGGRIVEDECLLCDEDVVHSGAHFPDNTTPQ